MWEEEAQQHEQRGRSAEAYQVAGKKESEYASCCSRKVVTFEMSKKVGT